MISRRGNLSANWLWMALPSMQCKTVILRGTSRGLEEIGDLNIGNGQECLKVRELEVKNDSIDQLA